MSIRKDVRVAIAGSVDSGKSTLLGVLTKGVLDNGRGLARAHVTQFQHELETGRTSSVTHHSMGYKLAATTAGAVDEKSELLSVQNYVPVFNPCPVSAPPAEKYKAWAQMGTQVDHIIDFNDNAGHEGYSRTAVRGISGSLPDYAILVVNASDGVLRMTKEHWAVIHALEIPLIIVLSKMDAVPAEVYKRKSAELPKYLKSVSREAVFIDSLQSVTDLLTKDRFLSQYTPIIPLSVVEKVKDMKPSTKMDVPEAFNLNLLHHLLANLKPMPLPEWTNFEQKCNVFAVDDNFIVPHVGDVLSGVVLDGEIVSKSTMLIGPILGNNREYPMTHAKHKLEFAYHYVPVEIRSVQKHRVNIETPVIKGTNCAVCVRPENRKYELSRDQLYRGLFLLDKTMPQLACTVFEAEVKILHHTTSIKVGYHSVIFMGMGRQTVKLLQIKLRNGVVDDLPMLRSEDKATVMFQFTKRANFLHPGMRFIFRDATNKGVGHVTKVNLNEEELNEVDKAFRQTKAVHNLIKKENRMRRN